MKRFFNFHFPTVFIILCFSAAAFSQTATIAPEKKKIIAEIIVVTKADRKTKEIMQAMFDQMNANYPLIIKALLEKRADITPARKARIARDLIGRRKDFDILLQRKMIEAINFEDFIEQTFYPLYDKYFTENELKDLLAFYKTPTGQKLNDALPQLAADAMRISQEYLIPKIDGVFEEVFREQAGISSPPPKSK